MLRVESGNREKHVIYGPLTHVCRITGEGIYIQYRINIFYLYQSNQFENHEKKRNYHYRLVRTSLVKGMHLFSI